MISNRRCVLASVLVSALSIQALAQQRCDLVTQQAKCLDLAGKNHAVLTVAANTTRIPADGLVLCGIPGSTPPPTDIVYIVDQSPSMKPTFIVPGIEDTSGWFSCQGGPNGDLPASYTDGLPSIDFHGNQVQVVTANTPFDTLLKYCSYADGATALPGVAGDPYSVRAKAVYAAIQSQAAKAPGSSAATINFAYDITTTQNSMTQLTPAGVNQLLTTVPLIDSGSTNYEAPLEWARILLFGGTSSKGTSISASPSPNKAIILISDGVPNAGTWQNALNPVDAVTTKASMFPGITNANSYAGNWTGDSSTIAPIFGIYLGMGAAQNTVLQSMSGQSGGAFNQIPPNMPDSLTRVIDKILGSLIKAAKPDTFLVRNLRNGQTSSATVSVASGNGYRMQLDSLVGLQVGANTIELTIKESGGTILDTVTINVSGSTSTGTLGLDTSLTTQCYPAASLVLQPDKSGRAYATDSIDRNILVTLHETSDGQSALPVSMATWLSGDKENLDLPIPPGTAKDSFGTFKGTIPWQALLRTGAMPGDAILRSGPGWDSAYAYFQMPRDPRDTASAAIGLRRAVAPSLSMTPSVEGPTGQVQVAVVDSNISAATISVTVRHRLGDTLSVKLTRVGAGTYQGSFSFAQGQAISLKDTILELAAIGTGLDSLTGNYQSLSALSYVQPAVFHLRFLDAQGGVHDSLGFDLAQGSQAPVTVQVWIGSSPCPTCGGQLSIVPSDPGLQILSTSGAAIGTVRLVGGQATIDAKGLRPVRSGSIVFTFDSLGTSISANPVRVLPPAPDSVVYLDMDGDGALDRAVLYLRSGWTSDNGLQLPWPDSTRFLPWQSASLSLSPDSPTVTFDFLPQSRDTTLGATPLSAHWRYDATWPWQNVKVVERIAPVPLRAILTRGTTYDTLRVYPSEPLWPSLSPLSSLVGRQVGAAVQPLLPDGARIETSTGALLLLIASDSTGLMVQPGDSVRFLSSVKDALGNAPGAISKRVVVEGSDPAPLDAVMVDSDGDGRADQVVVRLRAALSVTDLVGFLWPDTNGVLEGRTLPPSAGVSDSGGLRLTFSLDPFDFAATACPVAGCQALGYLSTTRFGSDVRTSFAIRDGVDPIPTYAQYRFAANVGVVDTLVVRFSEPVRKKADISWVSVGRPGRDSLGVVVKSIPAPQLIDGGRTAVFLVDNTFPGVDGDSLRITSATVGGSLSDTASNAPNRRAWWTPLLWKMPPPALTLGVPHAIVRSGTTDAPVGEAAVSVMVRTAETDAWKTIEGPVLTQKDQDTRIGGVVVHLNRIPQTLGMYIYDNLGVMVLKKDLSDLASQAAQGNLQPTARGDYQVWLTWNGLDNTGKPAASGVYLIRIFGWVKEGDRLLLLNQIKNTGFYRALPN